MATDRLAAYLHGDLIGEVRRGRRATVSLEWDRAWQPGPVTLSESFSLIPAVDPPDEAVSNWLGGYAPEGNQRVALAEARGVGPDDLFGLLAEFGGSMAGAVTLRLPDEPDHHVPRYEPLTAAMIGRRLRQAVERHDLGAHDDSRSMIPGFQPKLLLARLDGRWLEPHGRAHSTHLLKPRLDSRPHSLANEYYAYLLARRLGLANYDVEWSRFGGRTALVVERFDRRVDGDAVGLIHQEDLAQALGLDWRDADAKFQDPRRPRRRDRPSAGRIAELLGSAPRSGDLVTGWLRRLTFVALIGDNDAHAKNVALLHEPGRTRLADVYDSVPNLFQPGRLNYDMALAVDGVFDQRRISLAHLVAEGVSWGILPSATVTSVVTDTIAGFGSAVEEVTPPRTATAGLRRRFATTAQRLLAGQEIGDPA